MRRSNVCVHGYSVHAQTKGHFEVNMCVCEFNISLSYNILLTSQPGAIATLKEDYSFQLKFLALLISAENVTYPQIAVDQVGSVDGGLGDHEP